MKKKIRFTLAIFFAMLVPLAIAAPPQTINYQGYLTNASSVPVTNPALSMTFSLFTASSGGSALWSESQTVTVTNGQFNVALGTGALLTGVPLGSLAFSAPYYLEVTAGAETLTPRTALSASPYAFRAASLDSAATITGLQVSGTITTATLPTANLTGTISTAQIASNAVTQAKLSPVSGAAAGKVLGTDGVNLQWQTVGAGTITSLTQGAGITLTPNPITSSGTIAIDPASSALTGNYLKQGGNAFGAPAVLATTDNQPIELRANGARVMRYEPDAISPNLIAGSPSNSVTAGVRGATIAGGGVPNGVLDPSGYTGTGPNQVTSIYGTVAGGWANRAGFVAGDLGFDGSFSAISGGRNNTASGFVSTVSGGAGNIASGQAGTAGGGGSNTASGAYSTIGGGDRNAASGYAASVAGGEVNTASGGDSTVAGGGSNTASGTYSVVSGGRGNLASGDYSFAAGRNARTQSAGATPTVYNGAFTWADGSAFPFYAAGYNEFSARATGGVRFVTAIDITGAPTRTVSIDTNGEQSFGNDTRQMLNLWAKTYGIGVQDFAMYHRTGAHFAWYSGGTHSDNPFDPGVGGVALMTLTAGVPAGLPTATGTVRAQAFTVASDRNVKEAFATVSGAEVLAALVRMPLQSWKYRNEVTAIRHIGPTAQDFRAAFNVGYDDKTIATVDADGVALAAIQGLNQKLEAELKVKDTRSNQQEARILQLENALAAIQAMLGAR